MKNILNVLIESQLEIFASNYRNTSRNLFYDEEASKLIHPGEFGSWRESLLRELLSTFLPEAYGISQGFIIGPDGEVSNQCDVIIYARYFTPIIRTPEHQRFFPVESVLGVGEVKSVVDGTVLKDALEKLVRIKGMRLKLANPAIAYQRPTLGKYQPETLPRDQLGTFIFGEKIDIGYKTVADLVNKSIESKHPSLRPNFIASLDDYCTTYHVKEGRSWMYPIDVDGTALPLRFDIPESSKIEHLKLFLRYLLMVIEDATILYPELTHHFGGIGRLRHISERDI